VIYGERGRCASLVDTSILSKIQSRKIFTAQFPAAANRLQLLRTIGFLAQAFRLRLNSRRKKCTSFRKSVSILGSDPFLPFWIADAHREGKRFVVRADERLTAFMELECAVRRVSGEALHENQVEHLA